MTPISDNKTARGTNSRADGAESAGVVIATDPRKQKKRQHKARRNIGGSMNRVKSGLIWVLILIFLLAMCPVAGASAENECIFRNPAEAAAAYSRVGVSVIDVSDYIAAAVREDGTLLVSEEYGQQVRLTDYNDIVAVRVLGTTVIALRADGSRIIYPEDPETEQQFDILPEFTDIAIGRSSEDVCLLLLTPEGSVKQFDMSEDHSLVEIKGGMYGWSDIRAISAYYDRVLGLREDGTVAAAGTDIIADNCSDRVSDWSDVVEISAGKDGIFGFQSDETFLREAYTFSEEFDITGLTGETDEVQEEDSEPEEPDIPSAWKFPVRVFVSAGQGDSDRVTELPTAYLGKVLYIQDEVGGWFRMTAPADGDYTFSVLTDVPFSIELKVGDKSQTLRYDADGYNIQKQTVTGVREGEVLSWWNNGGNWQTLQHPFRMRITAESYSGSGEEADDTINAVTLNNMGVNIIETNGGNGDLSGGESSGEVSGTDTAGAREYHVDSYTATSEKVDGSPSADAGINMEVNIIGTIGEDGDSPVSESSGEVPGTDTAQAPGDPTDAAAAEAQLRARLQEQTGEEPFMFFCADYDGNGTHEAFALLGQTDEWSGYSGDIWFVNTNGATRVQQGLSYFKLEMLGNSPTMIFLAEEYYGGSGSTTHTWMVEGDQPKKVEAQVSGDLEWAGGNDYYGFPSAFDMYDDGTGHTWKRYYFYMDNGTLREYGGINISLDELLEFDGAAELIDAKLAEGYTVTGVIYRANGVINVNFKQDNMNANLSLRYDDTSVQYWEEDGGVYLTASDPSIAVYPEGFRHPSGTGSTAAAPNEIPSPSVEASPALKGYACQYDMDGDGTMENFLLYKQYVDDGWIDVQINLRITDAAGAVLADDTVYAYNEFGRADRRIFVYNLGNNRIFVHTQMRWDSIPDDFEFFRLEGGSLVEELHVSDVGPTDWCTLIDAGTEEKIFDSPDVMAKAGPAYMAALNKFMENYGYSFVARRGNAYIDLPDSQLICVATVVQFDPDGPVPFDEVTFASYDALPDVASAAPASAENPQPAAQGDADETNAGRRSAYTTGDVNLRSGPGLNYASIATIPAGNYVEYLNEEAVDERGVTWYHVSWAGKDGWGSSKYVVIG